jgi:hypothetical protein
VRIDQITPEIYDRMSPQDQAFYGGQPGIHPAYADDSHPPPKTDRLEREDQREFANWCLLKGYAFVWHGTHKRSTANLGCPDFIVALNRVTLWIEFKRPGEDLSEDQQKFRDRLGRQRITLYLVFSAHEAIVLTEKFDRVTL